MKIRTILAIAALFVLSSPAIAAQGSGCMPTTGTVSGLTFAQDINAGLAALISSNSGSSAPATDCSGAAVKGQFWVDTSVTPNLLKQYDGTAWIVLGAIDAANHLWSPPVGGGIASVTANSTTDICAAPAAVHNVSGSTPITSFGSTCAAVGIRKTLRFNSATPLTYNASSLIVPGAQSYTTSPGDIADALYLGSGNWQLISITRAGGSAVTNPAVPLATVLYGDYATLPPKTLYGYGQAIARSTYPAYTTAVTRTQSGTLTAGNNTITSVANTDGLGPGMPVESTGVQAGTTITSVTSTTIVMSQTAVANGAQPISVFTTGYGSGGSNTTVGVKDCRGRGIAGRDAPLGNTAGRFTSTVYGTGFNAINAASANQNETRNLNLSNLPPYTPSGTISISNGAITINGAAGYVYSDSGGGGLGGGGAFGHAGYNNLSASQGASSASFNGIAQGGSSAPFSILQPTVTAECVVVVQP